MKQIRRGSNGEEEKLRKEKEKKKQEKEVRYFVLK